MFVCEVGGEGSEDIKGQRFVALEIEFLCFSQLRPLTADSATDALGEPLYCVEAKAHLFAIVGQGAPSVVPKAIRAHLKNLLSLAKRILAIMESVSNTSA